MPCTIGNNLQQCGYRCGKKHAFGCDPRFEEGGSEINKSVIWEQLEGVCAYYASVLLLRAQAAAHLNSSS